MLSRSFSFRDCTAGDVGLTGKPPGGCLSTLASQAGRGKGLESALEFKRATTYCYLSDCNRYVISLSYTDKGTHRQTKWFSPWFGEPVTRWQWSVGMNRKVPDTGHMRAIGDAERDFESVKARCAAHAQARLPTLPAGNTAPASDQTPEGTP